MKKRAEARTCRSSFGVVGRSEECAAGTKIAENGRWVFLGCFARARARARIVRFTDFISIDSILSGP